MPKLPEKWTKLLHNLKPGDAEGKAGAAGSQSSESRDTASNVQAQAVDTATRTAIGDHGPTIVTDSEAEVDPLQPVGYLTTTDAGAFDNGEIVTPHIVAEVPEPETADENVITELKLDSRQVNNIDYSEPEVHSLRQPAAESAADYSDLVWDEAYDEVKREHSDMVTWYEQTLSTKLEQIGGKATASQTLSPSFDLFESHISQTDRRARRAQMQELLESWLSEVDDEEQSEDSNTDDGDLENGADAMTIRRILHQTAKTSKPNALLGWIGICLASRILLYPKPSNRDDCLGLIYVISRMDWYGRLTRLLLPDTEANDAQDQLRRRIVNLYKAILSYEMNFVCSHIGTLSIFFPSDVFKPREPNAVSLESIKDAERALPLFNEDSVHSPLMEQLSLYEKATAGQSIPDSAASESNSDGSSDNFNDMLRDLHCRNPWSTIPSAEERAIQALYDVFRSTEQYTDICNWENKENAVLWIRGAAGQGKTMLMKSVIRAISKASRSDSTPQCVPFLFNFSRSDSNHAAAALRNLIGGIIVRQRSLVTHLKSKRNGTNRTTFDDPNDFPALSGILYDMIRDEAFSETYFIVDGLDECSSDSGRPGLTDLVRFIHTSIESSERIRWIVSSDFSDAIESAFSNIQKCVTVDITSLDSSSAVRNYISDKVGSLAEAENYDEDLKNTIVARLRRRSPSNYLQVNLICEALQAEEKWYAERILDEVESLNDLDFLYRYFYTKLGSLPRDDGEFCLKILTTMAVVNRSLTLFELEGLVCLGHRVDIRSIVEKCNCFLAVSNEDIVGFYDKSAKDYVRRQIEKVSQTYANLIQRSIGSLVKALSGHALEKSSASRSTNIFLGWVYHLYNMIYEVVGSNESDTTSEIYSTVAEEVLSFLREHFATWLNVLSSEDLLDRAIILLRKVDLMVNSNLGEASELSIALRDAHLMAKLHMSTGSPKSISASNTMLFRPEESIANMKYSQDEMFNFEVIHLGNKAWRRDFGFLTGHSDWIRSIAFSFDGRLLASGSDDGTVRIWDTETWTTQHTLEVEKGWVYPVAFSPQGHVAAGSDESTITIWDSSLGCECHRLEKDPGKLFALAFSPDGRYLAAAGVRFLRIWKLDEQPETSYGIDHPGYVRSVAFSWDGALLASGANDGKIRIWDSWREINPETSPLILDNHTDTVNTVLFSPKTRPGYLASGSDDRSTRIWALNEEKSQCIQQLVSDAPVESVSFSPDGLQLAVAIDRDRIEIWDLLSGKTLTMNQTMKAKRYADILSMAFSPTGAYIASASRNGCVYLWHTASTNATKETYTQSPAVGGSINEVIVAPSGRTIAAGHGDGKVTIWDMNNKIPPLRLPFTHSRPILCLAFSPNGLILASGSCDGTAQICDVVKREDAVIFEGHSDYVRSVAWSPEGKYLASGSDDGSVRIYNYQVEDEAEGWREVKAVYHSRQRGNYVRAVVFSPNEAELYLAAGADDGKIVVWKHAEENWVKHQTIDAHSDYIRSIMFSPDGRRIVSSADDSMLRIWNFETTEKMGEAQSANDVVFRMRFEKGFETSGYVVTESGAQSVDDSITTSPAWCPYGYTRDWSSDTELSWITRYGEKAVLIPTIFSPDRSSRTATYFTGNKIIIGTKAGFVMVIRFPEEAPSSSRVG